MYIRNPRAPKELFHGLAFAGGMEHPGTTYYHDASGLGNTGTLTNMDPATDWVWSEELGRWTVALTSTSGAFDHVDLGTIAHGIGTGDFAVAAWARVNLANVFNHGLWCNGAYAPVFCAARSTSPYQVAAYWGSWRVFTSIIPTNTWTHLVFQRTAGVLRAYINGVVDATTFAITTSMTNAQWRWGYDGSSSRFVGDMAGNAVFTRGLSQPEISWLADPTHHLRVPWRRTVWPVVSASATGSPWYYHLQQTLVAGTAQ